MLYGDAWKPDVKFFAARTTPTHATPQPIQVRHVSAPISAAMWLWVALGWAGCAAGAAWMHHRLRRATGRHPPEVVAFVLQLENELAHDPRVHWLGLLPDRFACLLRVDQQETVVGLHEAFRHAQAFPSQFATMVRRLIDDVRQIGLDHVGDIDFAAAADRLLPQVRSKAWLLEQGCFGDSGLAYTPLNDELVTVYALDQPQSMVFVCRAHLRLWRKNEVDLHNLALANLAARGKPIAATVEGPPVRVSAGDGYDAARVLLLDAVDGLLVAVPDRDTLWVGNAEGPLLEQLMATTEAIAEQAAHPVSGRVFRVTDGQLAALPARTAE